MKRHRRRRAFTLIELLAALAITAALVGFIVIIVNNVAGFWTRSSGRLSTGAQARLIFDQLELDLQSAVFRDDGQVWLAATVLENTANAGDLWDTRGATLGALRPATAAGTGLNYSATAITDATFGQAGTWLRFITHRRGANVPSDPATASAPVAVGWQIVRRASSAHPANKDRRYFLHRCEVRPALVGTLEAGYDLSPTAENGYTARSGRTNTGDARTLQIPANLASVVGENTIDFGVRVYGRETATGALTLIFPNSPADRMHLAKTPPAMVEVMVRILTEEGARLVADFEANPQRLVRPEAAASDAAYWWPLAVAHSQVFTRRIAIRAEFL